jgi:hypothetical protein
VVEILEGRGRRNLPARGEKSHSQSAIPTARTSRAGRAVEDTITSIAVDLVAQCDRVIAAKGGLVSEVG